MHAIQTAPTAPLSVGQLHRLETANLVIASLAKCGLEVFGKDAQQGRLEPIPTGGFRFIQGIAGAQAVNMAAPPVGSERLLPGFRGGYATQRILRCLVTYILEARAMPAGMLARALMGSHNRYFDQVKPDFERVIAEFRFSRVFMKPVISQAGLVE